eukprot:SAG11_NODE_34146_length_273_cov_1.178161_1_plen_54_part_10
MLYGPPPGRPIDTLAGMMSSASPFMSSSGAGRLGRLFVQRQTYIHNNKPGPHSV